MDPIGPIVRLQVQTEPLKTGERGARRYVPDAIRRVEALRLTASGTYGLVGDAEVLDVHNAAHPCTRFNGENGVSILFTSHYRTMRQRFGDHVADGIAGESVLVDAPGIVTEGAILGKLVIVGADGVRADLTALKVAEPCVEFTAFMLREPNDNQAVAAALPDLRDGVRGFYARLDGPEVTVREGDLVYRVL